MSSSGSSEENSLADIINPYMRELKMHPKELSLKDGKVQIEDVRDPKGVMAYPDHPVDGPVTPGSYLGFLD
jgi:hypothetical protein